MTISVSSLRADLVIEGAEEKFILKAMDTSQALQDHGIMPKK